MHPAKWDIGQFWGAFVTDADWGIPSGGSFGISIQFKMSGIDRFVYNSIYHSHLFGFHISHFNSIFTFVLSFQIYTQSMYSFHILIHVLISYTHSYTHSCTHFIYTWQSTKILEIRIESENQLIYRSFVSLDSNPRSVVFFTRTYPNTNSSLLVVNQIIILNKYRFVEAARYGTFFT